MKFSLNWLKQHLETQASVQEIVDKLNTLGMEVEEFADASENLKNVVIGKIISRKQHPNADKLGVCQVEVGKNDIRQIVCGAPNARDGLTVAVALEGACLPGDFKIKKSKLRGETSNGMICSVKELGLGSEADGIWELNTDKQIGTPIVELLNDLDATIEIDITPNRSDVLSVYGVARDLAATGIGTLKDLSVKDFSEGFEQQKNIEIKNDKCSLFASLEIKNVKNVESPEWLQDYLIKAGLRPINAIADITNYVMLDLGQPLHAYDFDKVQGNIFVGNSKGGETLDGLDGANHTLPSDAITINDESGVIGLGGIVGGESTSVDENTTKVFLEAANFDKVQIALSGQALQINTDARYRFERGVDPLMTRIALSKAAELIQEICGGEISKLNTVETKKYTPKIIKFETSKMKSFAGVDIPENECIELLEKLYYKCEKVSNGIYNVTVPSFVHICNNFADLIEEILRLKGFESIPVTLPAISLRTVSDWDNRANIDKDSRKSLVSLGYTELLNYSFISPELTELFSSKIERLILANPISEELSNMRQTLIPGLCESAVKNIKRGHKNLMLAEVGKIFNENSESLTAAALRTGLIYNKSWNNEVKSADVFDIKADLFAFLETLNVDIEKLVLKDSGMKKYYHPGRAGLVMYKGKEIAQFGELHPYVAKQVGLKSQTVIFEVDLEKLIGEKLKQNDFSISQYQAVKRDFAFVIDKSIKAGDLLKTIKNANKELIKNVSIFDLYQGEKLEDNQKSLAFSVVLQSDEKTLKDSEINAVADKIINSVTTKFKAKLR